MKKVTLFLFAASLLPSCVLAWNTPGEDFSGKFKLEGPVTSTRNPWVWKVGQGNESLEVKQSRDVRDGGQGIPVALPAMTVLLGKTTLTTPAGREGLSPRVSYGKGAEGFSLVWTAPGMAEVTLPVTGDNNARAGTFVFRMQAVGVLRHVQDGQPVYVGVYDDLNANGLPAESKAMKVSDIPGILQKMFSGEGPSWLQTMTVTATAGLSRFSDAALRQIEGAYGAQTMADSGELRLNGAMPERWRVSLPVSIEYQ
ncbi:F4 (K88) fimbria minor subunit FaeI [Yersinia enterocolitica]|uniref:F4 family fimbrial subunit n=1 Tax=Yersinia enterocolitica TaxID=630 RepID=UPI001C60E6FD|nr:F4 (K88) fimbria minor subunit FaeI [Yersinia enterocolitica]MBW5840165.1 F4 (K88) fimbria minor subunit FaeI [Yersinia enterocolitica]MBW5848767.1 F4 (K88) fimbria minor subunit FaeI [Yersinia enterocolitica]MBW5857547.1 F4 (K88) fimbria minor subunit FaeI [Yersinia enterocolitica]MBW5861880.1 F4 (K88) fimbria minor subunit FaeI [Yersinia enterocolitica]MBW5866170.1 F4 (K88) fimbria minor subunit FaeI [Yersinia enterocolitica]